jgi:hypothetical protein
MPGDACGKRFNPASLGVAEYERLKAIYGAVTDNLLYHI